LKNNLAPINDLNKIQLSLNENVQNFDNLKLIVDENNKDIKTIKKS
jgi:hypothetical protein